MNKKSKLFEIENYENSNTPWKKDTYNNYDVNIGIQIFDAKTGYQWDEDPFDYFPELDEILGDRIYFTENGFIGLNTDETVDEIKDILIKNKFKTIP